MAHTKRAVDSLKAYTATDDDSCIAVKMCGFSVSQSWLMKHSHYSQSHLYLATKFLHTVTDPYRLPETPPTPVLVPPQSGTTRVFSSGDLYFSISVDNTHTTLTYVYTGLSLSDNMCV